jgi:hypothetical protein
VKTPSGEIVDRSKDMRSTSPPPPPGRQPGHHGRSRRRFPYHNPRAARRPA